MENMMFLVPVAAVLALLFAAYLAAKVSKEDVGTDRMKEIADAIAEGARAFLMAEYKILVIFVAVLFVLIGFGISWVTAVCFVVGALFSTIAGYCGMTVATKANVRTANAAKEHGMNKALSIAFSGGAVMGMCVAGLGALGVSLVYIVTKNVDVLFGFSLGASSIALFARVGGGIYTKAADVGADLVGKVEAGIPEDDPRNPAVIADNVGDNVGDVAGMGADLFESYVGSLVSALTLGAVTATVSGVLFPLAIAACGLIASILGTFFVKGGENANPQKALTKGDYASAIIVVIASVVLSKVLFDGFEAAIAVIAGLVVGALCGAVNGFILTRFKELPPMIVTLATQIIFRGIAEVTLGAGGSIAITNTDGFRAIGGKVGNIPYILFLVLILGVLFAIFLGKSTFGRRTYAIGTNRVAAYYAGVHVEKIRFIIYTVMGLMSGLCAVFLVSSSYGANTTTGNGFEMDAIAMAVFGGISSTGGKGNLAGGIISAFIIVCLRVGLGQKNVNAQVILLIIGVLLICAVALPNVVGEIKKALKVKKNA